MRWIWVGLASVAVAALVTVALALSGVTKRSATRTVTTARATSSAQPRTLPYDAEENAFMGQYSWRGDADTSTGCLSEQDSQAVCDCAYRRLRAEGHPASELAAVGSAVRIDSNSHLPVNDPSWMATTIAACWADLQGGG